MFTSKYLFYLLVNTASDSLIQIDSPNYHLTLPERGRGKIETRSLHNKKLISKIVHKYLATLIRVRYSIEVERKQEQRKPTMTAKKSKVQETVQDIAKESIDKVISELSRDQCQLLLYNIGVGVFRKHDHTLRLLVQSHLNAGYLSEISIREVC